MNIFTVKQEHFEGPLDVLLNLIEKRKLFINDISLAKVADDYLAYVKGLENFPIADSANFILVASTLVLIKSKSLLPSLELTSDEQGDIADLERRLKIYQRIRELSVGVKALFGRRISFTPEPRKVEPVFSPDKQMSLYSFLAALKEVLQGLPKKESLPKVAVLKIMSLEEMIINLTKRVTDALRMSFRDFTKGEKPAYAPASKYTQAGSHTDMATKVHIIVSFLAMLELVKQGVISVTQDKHFEDIVMETEWLGVPKY